MNLVRVFVAIYETRSLTLAAERLYVTQSAVSQSLSRLRRELDDPLFERAGRVVAPTQLADHVFPQFRDATVSIDNVLDDIRGFDPTSTTHRFRIAMSELGETSWLPRIAEKLSALAPGAQLDVVALDTATLAERLSRGAVDIAIAAVDLGGRYVSTVAKWDEYCVAMSASNPLAETGITVATYAAAPRAVIVSDSAAPVLESAELRAGVDTEPTVRLQHYAALPALLLSRPALVAPVPESIAADWSHDGPLVVRPLPFPMAAVQVRVYQRAATQQRAALDWFYTLVCSAVSKAA